MKHFMTKCGKRLFAAVLTASLLISSFALLVSSLPLFAFAETDDEVQAVIDAVASMLEEEREPGVILVSMKDGVTPEEALEIFSALGIGNDLDDREVFRYCSYDDGFTDILWFTVIVPEERIQELLVALTLHEKVRAAYPNFIIWEADDDPIEDDRELLYGDVNLDGKLNATDYMLVKRVVLRSFSLSSEEARIAADVNKNGKIDATDYMLIKRSILGSIAPLGVVE